MEKINITVDGKKIETDPGRKLLEVLEENGYEIPKLCHHPDLEPEENCRLCLVEVDGRLKTSCAALVKDGMEVKTDSENIKKYRRINAMLVLENKKFAHDNRQMEIISSLLPKSYDRLAPRKTGRGKFSFGQVLFYDLEKCVDCRACVQACELQDVHALKMEGYGVDEKIFPNAGRQCIYCGQCLAHCPSGAISTSEPKYAEISAWLADKKTVKVAQIAPAVRAAIGELFGLPYGAVTLKKLVTALKKIGFNYVFDTTVGADFTTVEEAKELAERLKGKNNLPLMTSCCPAWVRFVEVYYPQYKKNLTTVRSPQMILGNIIKGFWAGKNKIDPRVLKVVSIMPCTAKNWESQRPDYFVDGQAPVDKILTTVETARMIREKGIDFNKLEETEPDNPLGQGSGAGVIYGATGGVMVSALRTAYFLLAGKNPEVLEFEEITKLEGLKTYNAQIGGNTVRIAVIDGLGNFRKIADKVADFDYIEVMACRGGCLAGGGQPTPVNDAIRKKRAAALFSLDKKSDVRLAHENPWIKQVYAEFLTDDETVKKYCHLHG